MGEVVVGEFAFVRNDYHSCVYRSTIFASSVKWKSMLPETQIMLSLYHINTRRFQLC